MRWPGRGQNPPRAVRSTQKQPEAAGARSNQKQPGPATSSQKQARAPKSSQKRPRTARSSQEPIRVSNRSLWSGDVVLGFLFKGTAPRRLELCARKAGVGGVLGFSFACGLLAVLGCSCLLLAVGGWSWLFLVASCSGSFWLLLAAS